MARPALEVAASWGIDDFAVAILRGNLSEALRSAGRVHEAAALIDPVTEDPPSQTPVGDVPRARAPRPAPRPVRGGDQPARRPRGHVRHRRREPDRRRPGRPGRRPVVRPAPEGLRPVDHDASGRRDGQAQRGEHRGAPDARSPSRRRPRRGAEQRTDPAPRVCSANSRNCSAGPWPIRSPAATSTRLAPPAARPGRPSWRGCRAPRHSNGGSSRRPGGTTSADRTSLPTAAGGVPRSRWRPDRPPWPSGCCAARNGTHVNTSRSWAPSGRQQVSGRGDSGAEDHLPQSR